MQNDVRIFMEACGQAVQTGSIFTHENHKQTVLYLTLIREEMAELEAGLKHQDIVETADACGDLIWVILGLCNTLGIPMGPVWQEITSSNMSKTVDGQVIRREDGKILKPTMYFPPNIHRALQLQDLTNE